MPEDNEKFKARCMLLALGFIGDEFAQARKILLAPMSGNGSHRAGDGKKAALKGTQAADSGAGPDAGACVLPDAYPADGADFGGEALAG